ncbi:hypothetical protein AAIR98_001072 [Elusimicrobium simillimum]|uniref:hypothetical protein n=1 Tax=Elusimicrobium simillimum TaxID=3143438 RepID=UPI003C6F401A
MKKILLILTITFLAVPAFSSNNFDTVVLEKIKNYKQKQKNAQKQIKKLSAKDQEFFKKLEEEFPLLDARVSYSLTYDRYSNTGKILETETQMLKQLLTNMRSNPDADTVLDSVSKFKKIFNGGYSKNMRDVFKTSVHQENYDKIAQRVNSYLDALEAAAK